MSTISRWVVPCNFVEGNHGVNPIQFDLTDHLKIILKNQVWTRKLAYGYNSLLENIDESDIIYARINIFPRFLNGVIDEERLIKIVENVCGKIPDYLNVNNYNNWRYELGMAIIEVEYKSYIKNIPTKTQLAKHSGQSYDLDFIRIHDKYLAVIKELASLFLAGLHLSIPSESIFQKDDNPIYSGFFQISSTSKTYAKILGTNIFMHAVLIDINKKTNVENNIKEIAKIWQFELWPLKRYLKAVESDQISMDNLLDLMYSLEGMFGNDASSEFIKLTCITQLCKTKSEAKKIRSVLNEAFRIRNSIVHGGLFYDAYDQIKLNGKMILAQSIYWEMKRIVAGMIFKAISKLIRNPGNRHLAFNSEDLIDNIFVK